MADETPDPVPSTWVVIPARGGSVGIPRKNLRMLGGMPLIGHVIRTARSILPRERVVVVTDDDEIAHVAGHLDATVILEDAHTPSEETLDTKIVRNLPRLRELGAQDDDIVATVQPTSPLLSPESLRAGLSRFRRHDVASVVSVADDRHLRWSLSDTGTPTPAFAARVNRQQLPWEFRETGGIIAARLKDIEEQGTRVIAPVDILQLGRDEAIDIDDYSDLYAAAHLLSRKRIAVRVDASKSLGMGHVYRGLALVSELARHEVIIYLSAGQELGHQFFAKHPYAVETVTDDADFCARLREFRPDLVVLDILDTDTRLIDAIRDAVAETKIVTFEDRGAGAIQADLLVAEFIDNHEVPESRKLTGIDYALLSPSFEVDAREPVAFSPEVENVLVLFGGTDPSMLAARAVNSLVRVGYGGSVTIVRGLGAEPIRLPESPLPFTVEILENVKNMAALMSRADLAYTSAGRTVVELISRGVPSICLAQNPKEATHTHAIAENGVLSLGLGTAVDDHTLDEATRTMLHDHALRRHYAERARTTGARRRNRTTISTILSRLGFEDFPDI